MASAELASGTGAASSAKGSVQPRPTAASGTGNALNADPLGSSRSASAPPTPGTLYNLFRGQIIEVTPQRVGTGLRLVIEAEDYNRQFPRIAVGFGEGGGNYFTQPDGTRVFFDAYPTLEIIAGQDGDLVKRVIEHYFGAGYFTFSNTVNITAPGDFADVAIDHTIAYEYVADLLAAIIQRVSGSARYWVDPDRDVNYQAVAITEYGAVAQPDAPFILDNDGPWSGTTIQPKSIDISHDFRNVAKRAKVRGGSPAATKTVVNLPAGNGGDQYVDAPSASTSEDADAVADWWLQHNLSTALSGTAVVPAGFDGAGGKPWRIGQRLTLRDLVYSRVLAGPSPPVLPALPSFDPALVTIQGVTARLVSPGAPIGIAIWGVDWTPKVSAWQSLRAEQRLDGPGRATFEVDIVDDAEDLYIGELADIRIWTDGNAEIEYDLAFGDIAPGSMSLNLDRAKAAEVEFVPPSYKFVFTIVDPGIPDDGSTTDVTAQITQVTGIGTALYGILSNFTILQWSDDALSVPGDGYVFDDTNAALTTGTTNAGGQVYLVMRHDSGSAKHFQIEGVALPVP